jgi:hypothetical protein
MTCSTGRRQRTNTKEKELLAGDGTRSSAKDSRSGRKNQGIACDSEELILAQNQSEEKIGGYEQIETRNFTRITSTHERTDLEPTVQMRSKNELFHLNH